MATEDVTERARRLVQTRHLYPGHIEVVDDPFIIQDLVQEILDLRKAGDNLAYLAELLVTGTISYPAGSYPWDILEAREKEVLEAVEKMRELIPNSRRDAD